MTIVTFRYATAQPVSRNVFVSTSFNLTYHENLVMRTVNNKVVQGTIEYVEKVDSLF